MKKGSAVLLILSSMLLSTSGCNFQPTFRWSNPMTYSFDAKKGLRDPFILKYGDLWYMTGTQLSIWIS